MSRSGLIAVLAVTGLAGASPAAEAFNPQPEPPGRTGLGLLTATDAGIEDPNLRAYEAAWSRFRGNGSVVVLPGLGKETVGPHKGL